MEVMGTENRCVANNKACKIKANRSLSGNPPRCLNQLLDSYVDNFIIHAGNESVL